MENLIIERIEVWAAPIKDSAGSLAQILRGLREAGADLDFVISRRAPENPGAGVVFVTPLHGDKEIAAASILGFNVSTSVHSVRVEGENKPGVAAMVTGLLGEEGISLRGFSASVSGARFVIVIGLDSEEDSARTMDILQRAT